MPEFALEIPYLVKENFPLPLIDFWGRETISDPIKWFLAAQDKAFSVGAKYISLHFNLEYESEIEPAINDFNKIQSLAKISLIVRGSGQKDFDKNFIPLLVKNLKTSAIIAFAQDLNYEAIVKSVLKSPFSSSIKLVLRAPIDINLSKELNVLCMDLGLKSENIIMDTDTGCVGMGLDYGYSIIERLVAARKEGDAALKPPLIVFSGEESFKSKESKSNDFKDTRGSLEIRSCTVEIATTMALITAGADIAVVYNPKTVEAIYPLLSKGGETLCL